MCIRGDRIIEIKHPLNMPLYEYRYGQFVEKTIYDLVIIKCTLYNILE